MGPPVQPRYSHARARGRDRRRIAVEIAGVIFAEKVLPRGLRLSRAVAAALVLLGIWVAVAPSSVPGLTEPDRPPSMQMEM